MRDSPLRTCALSSRCTCHATLCISSTYCDVPHCACVSCYLALSCRATYTVPTSVSSHHVHRYGLLVLGLAEGDPLEAWLGTGPLHACHELALGIYLFQEPAVWSVMLLLPTNGAPSALDPAEFERRLPRHALALLLDVALAALVHRTVQRPISRLVLAHLRRREEAESQ